MKDHIPVLLRPMTKADWFAVAEIYREGINTGNASFDLEVPSWKQWDNSHLKSCRVVCELGNVVIGWAALSPVSERCVYEGVAEISVYVASKYRGIGLGKELLRQLIAESEQKKIWTLQSGVFPENKTSLAIHEQMGFRCVGFRERIGYMNGIWRDIILLEKRSRLIGID